MTAGSHLHELVDAERLPLSMAPRLASWDASASRSQIALATYLDHVKSRVESARPGGMRAVHLTVPVPSSAPGEGHDLDNYLQPLAHRLGAQGLDLVRGSKVPRGMPVLTVGDTRARSDPDPAAGWRSARVGTTGSTEGPRWKEEVHRQVAAQVDDPVAPGKVEFEIAFLVGPARNWLNLWKPAIDSVGPIVGEGDRPFAPRDDLIMELGLHRTVVSSLGNSAELRFWWRHVPD